MRFRRLTALLALLAFLVSPGVWAGVTGHWPPIPAESPVATVVGDTESNDCDEPTRSDRRDDDHPHSQDAACCHASLGSGAAGAALGIDETPDAPRSPRDAFPIEGSLSLAGLDHPPPLKPPR